MKKLLFITAALAGLALSGCSQFSNRGTVERPFIESANTESLSFDRIELTDSSTVLHAVVHFRPHWWIKITPESFIVADGDTLRMTAIDGITPDEEFWMPESGVTHFTMTYPAIPASVKSIDFSEDSPTGWMLWGIDLTGQASTDTEGVPAALKAEVTDTELPEAVLDVDSVTMQIHVLGYRPAMGKKLNLVVNSITGQETPEVTLDPQGNATFSAMIAGPTAIHARSIGDTNVRGAALVNPGETIDLYVDARFSGAINMRERGDNDVTLPKGYASGTFSGLTRAMNEAGKATEHNLEIYSGVFGDYHMNGDQYTEYIIDTYRAEKDSIAAANLSPLAEKYMNLTLDSELIIATQNADNILRNNYYITHGNSWGSPIPADSINCELSADNLRRIASLVDLNNPGYLALYYYTSINELANNTAIWKDAGIDARMLSEMEAYTKAYSDAASMKLTDAQLDELRGFSTPFYAKAAESKQKEVTDFMARARLDLIQPTPAVSTDKIFDAIIAPHKGKVVMVDLWNTWCGPCRAAIAENEPEKGGDLASDDIVWIYISDESSPLEKYMEMIPGIRGLHYRLTAEQISAIRNRFDVDGIPFYILVDRNGKAKGRPDLRDHKLFKKTLLDEVAKN